MLKPVHIPSLGLLANQALDKLGYPDKFGDLIGAKIDFLSGKAPGGLQNLRDFISKLPTSQFLRGAPVKTLPYFPPHRTPSHGCFPKIGHTYFKRERLATKASDRQIADIQDLNIGLPRKINDTLERKAARKLISASYQRPIRLKNGKWLSRGMVYNSYRDILADKADGSQGGWGTVAYGPGGRRPVINSFLGNRPIGELNKLATLINQFGRDWNANCGGCWQPRPGWNQQRPALPFPIFPPGAPGQGIGGGTFPSFDLGNVLQNAIGNLFGGGGVGGTAPGGGTIGGGFGGNGINDRLVSAFGPAIGKADSDVQRLMQRVQANPDDQQARFALQQAMQRRTELITLLTNLMKSEHDARMAIARNLRV